jgi:hypothetical protein
MFGLVPIFGFSVVLVPGIAHLVERLNERTGSLLGLDDRDDEDAPDED